MRERETCLMHTLHFVFNHLLLPHENFVTCIRGCDGGTGTLETSRTSLTVLPGVPPNPAADIAPALTVQVYSPESDN